MRALREYVIVKVPSVFIEESRYKGVDNKTIVLNVTFNPERHIRVQGIVTSVPDELTRIPLSSNHISAPGYHDYPVWNWKTNEDIELEVQVGDKVYFHYNCLLPDHNGGSMWNHLHIESKKDEHGKLWHYFLVKYNLVFAAVRYEPMNRTISPFDWSMEPGLKPWKIAPDDLVYCYVDDKGYENFYRKKVIMVGSYVFVEPDMETWDDITIPTPEVINGKKILNPDGSVRMKPKEQWLVIKSRPDKRYLCGWVRFCGSPLKGDKEFLRPGMYVHFQPNSNTPLHFEGFDYFRMMQRHVIGIAQRNLKPVI